MTKASDKSGVNKLFCLHFVIILFFPRSGFLAFMLADFSFSSSYRASATTIRVQSSLPDVNHDHPRPVAAGRCPSFHGETERRTDTYMVGCTPLLGGTYVDACARGFGLLRRAVWPPDAPAVGVAAVLAL